MTSTQVTSAGDSSFVSASVQVLWWLAAAGTVIIRARDVPSSQGLPGGVAVAGQGKAGRL